MSEEKEKCSKCQYWIPDLNKFGSSHCFELNITMKELPIGCLHFKLSDRFIEVKFDSSKEKIFIFIKPTTTTRDWEAMLNLFKVQSKSKVFLLPTNIVESVKVIKDVKE